MRCDQHGNPDPNGGFDLIDGKVILRNGTAIRYDIMARDTAASRSSVFLTDTTKLTDAERAFADSAAGHLAVAKARAEHARQYRYLSDGAPLFTDAMAAAAARSAMIAKAPAIGIPLTLLASGRTQVDQARREWRAERAGRYAAAHR